MGTIMMISFLNKRAALLPPRMGNLQFGSFIKSGGYRLGRTRGKATGTSMVAHHREVFLYEEWLVEHGKLYNTPEEKDKRFRIFKDNLRYINKINSINPGYRMELNQFSDLTDEEFRATYYRSLRRTRGKATGTSMVAHHRDKATGRTKQEVVFLYEEWHMEHDKLYYTPEEKDKRFRIFKDNLRYIDKINSTNPGYTLGLNQFSDLTNEEFRATYLCGYRGRGKATVRSMAAHHWDKATGRTEEEVVSLYEEWLVQYGKLYNTPEEKDKRFRIFKDKLRYIDKINSTNPGYTLGLNQFSDLTFKEFSAKYLCDFPRLRRTRGKATGTSMAAHLRDKATGRTSNS